jgi:Ca2+-binding RTX toxin-like protein
MLVSPWLRRFRNRHIAQPRRGLRTVEQLEQRTYLTVSGILVGTELTVFVDDGDDISIQNDATTGNVQVLSNGTPATTIPTVQSNVLTGLRVRAGDDANVINLSAVTSADFSALALIGSIIVEGGDGDDTITGSADFGEDLRGQDGNDVITGDAGNDTIDGGDGNDSITAGDGNDSIDGDDGDDTIDAGGGNDNIEGGSGADSIIGGAGMDTIDSGQGNDFVDAGDDNDIVNGMSGADTIDGGAGNDSLLGGAGNDAITGGTGDDRVDGQGGADTVSGGDGADRLNGSNQADSISGGIGNDTINGGRGNDTLTGGDDNDTIYGGAGNDLVFGDSSVLNDVRNFNDLIRGQGGNDTIIGGGGADTLLGNAGDDLVSSGDIESETTALVSIDVQVSVVEGNAGTVPVTVNLQLQRAFSTPVDVVFITTDGTAVAGSDYVTAMGTVTFNPGETVQSITVDVLGDAINEADEFFTVDLLSATGGVILSGQAQIVILNDDVWTPQGPAPNTNGQTENVAPDNEITGAVHALAAHPTDADVLYLGGTNGGVWRTSNATAASPSWEPLTDELSAQSIGALTLDGNNPDRVLVGIGRYSSFGRVGSNRDGLLLSEDRGDTWTQIMDPLLTGRNISGVILRDSLLLASSNFFAANGGLSRSTDNGATWTLISGTGGLPNAPIHDLVEDPSDPNRFYAAVQSVGIFVTTDSGVTWANISASDAALNPIITAASNNNTEMAVAANGRLFIAVLQNGQAAYIGFTDNQGGNWTRMDLPMTPDTGNGADEGLNPRVKPGGQGAIHFSIVVDPNDPNTVYVGGDRQDTPFPNFIGAVNFSGRLFRGDTTVTPTGAVPSPQWEHLTHSDSVTQTPGGGTASSSSPHADSREMTFLANGDLIEGDDGGIYRRTSPQDNTGDWFSINGDLQVTEFHNIAYDTNADIIFGGAQDTGTPQQVTPGGLRWTSVSTADGGDVAVDTTSSPGMSVRYSSFQNLGAFRRRTYDASNTLITQVFPARTVVGGGAVFAPQFVTPVEVNVVDGTRLILGGNNSPYESLDQAGTITELTGVGGVNRDALAYGGFQGTTPNADVLYVGSGGNVFVRTAGTASPTQAATYPGGFVRDIVLDNDDFMTAWVIDSDQVFQTGDAGTSWTDITGDLPNDDLRSVEFITGTNDFVAVGTRVGVFIMNVTTTGVWVELDPSLPTVPVYDLDYDAADDVLVAGTLGRGAWLFQAASQAGATNTPLPPPPVATLLVSLGDTIDGGNGNDTLRGADGDDVVTDTGGNNLIESGLGNDSILGGPANDTIRAGGGDDTVAGRGGDDLIDTGSGNDLIIWNGVGNGVDTVLDSDGTQALSIQGSAASNTFVVDSVVSGDNTVLRVSEGVASITTSQTVGEVSIMGGGGDDMITVNSIAQVRPQFLLIDGQAGNDTITAANARIGRVFLELRGGDDDDTITGSRDGDDIFGDAGNDLLMGGDGDDSLDGGTGLDVLNGDAGNDTLFGNLDNDTINGGDGDDSADGGFGNDNIDGDGGSDSLDGGFGNDTLNGSSGNDLLEGGPDNDRLLGGSGTDSLDGGTGNDTIRGQSGADFVKGGDGNDSILGGGGNDVIDGGDGNDTINAGNGADIVDAGDGNDSVNGMSGRDTLIGNDGNDTLIGGGSVDQLFGGDGTDTLRGNGSTDKFNSGEGGQAPQDLAVGELDDQNLMVQMSVLQALAELNGF